jgi:hypothetical protein
MLLTLAAGVIPAKAGIQGSCGFMDPGLRRGDVKVNSIGDKPRPYGKSLSGIVGAGFIPARNLGKNP